MSKATARNIAGEVTAMMIEKLEAGVLPWRRPWSLTGEGGAPLRHEGTPYTRINVPLLWGIAEGRGYRSRYWMTARQAEQIGGCVRRDAMPSISVYSSSFRKAGTSLVTGQTFHQLIRFLRSYLVYNADEIDGLPAWYYPRDVAPTRFLLSQRQAAIDAFFAPIPAEIRHGGDEAFFAVLSDHIQMPHQQTFLTADGYWDVRAHESCHWAGGPSRLNRTFGKRFGDQAYAMEELVASLGQAMICAELGLPTELHDNHASYLSHWIDVLKADASAIFLAATQAEKAVAYLRSFRAAASPTAIAA